MTTLFIKPNIITYSSLVCWSPPKLGVRFLQSYSIWAWIRCAGLGILYILYLHVPTSSGGQESHNTGGRWMDTVTWTVHAPSCNLSRSIRLGHRYFDWLQFSLARLGWILVPLAKAARDPSESGSAVFECRLFQFSSLVVGLKISVGHTAKPSPWGQHGGLQPWHSLATGVGTACSWCNRRLYGKVMLHNRSLEKQAVCECIKIRASSCYMVIDLKVLVGSCRECCWRWLSCYWWLVWRKFFWELAKVFFFWRMFLAKDKKWSKILSEIHQSIDSLLSSPLLSSPLLSSPLLSSPLLSSLRFLLRNSRKNGESQDNEIAKDWLCWEPRGP